MCPVDGRPSPVQRDGTLVIVLAAPLRPADTVALCRRLEQLIAVGGVRRIVCDVGAVGHPDLAVVDTLARLQLVGRRGGHPLRLVHAGRGLRELLELVGLDEAAPSVDAADHVNAADHVDAAD